MEIGVTGLAGLIAQGLAEQGRGAGQEDAATQRRLMGAETVQDQATSLESVTQTLVQV